MYCGIWGFMSFPSSSTAAGAVPAFLASSSSLAFLQSSRLFFRGSSSNVLLCFRIAETGTFAKGFAISTITFYLYVVAICSVAWILKFTQDIQPCFLFEFLFKVTNMEKELVGMEIRLVFWLLTVTPESFLTKSMASIYARDLLISVYAKYIREYANLFVDVDSGTCGQIWNHNVYAVTKKTFDWSGSADLKPSSVSYWLQSYWSGYSRREEEAQDAQWGLTFTMKLKKENCIFRVSCDLCLLGSTVTTSSHSSIISTVSTLIKKFEDARYFSRDVLRIIDNHLGDLHDIISRRSIHRCTNFFLFKLQCWWK